MLSPAKPLRQPTPSSDHRTPLIARESLLTTWLEFAITLAIVMVLVIGVMMLLGPM